MLTAVAAGEANVICSLAENPLIKAVVSVSITTFTGEQLRWLQEPPESLEQYQEAVVEAALQGEDVEYSFGGADSNCYEASVTGNVLTLKCWQPSDLPLTITAKCGEDTITASIRLEGW